MNANTMRNAVLSRMDASEIRGQTFDDRDIEIALNTGQIDEIMDMFMPDKNARGVGYSDDKLRLLQLSGLVVGGAVYTKANDDFMVGTAENGALAKPHEDSNSIQYGVFVRVPNEYLFPTLIRTSVEKSGCAIRSNIKTMLIDELYYEEYINNGQRQPYKSLVWTLEYGNYSHDTATNISTKGVTGVDNNAGAAITIDANTYRSHLIIPGKDFVVLEYSLRYVKTPINIVIDIEDPSSQVNCQLNDQIHKNIVERAVALLVASAIPKEGKYQISQGEVVNNA